ncbi:hypothetical protein P43SY_007240 [Pythium insidiosum]|uniref:Uncharacterized protein n=1 Tax=Pythium insidiosum TaxID=114742 RepID=A0AAD5LXM2_PYTIN|nr:hypothetical protein P43SY_007240 [Pythium insidiosum]
MMRDICARFKYRDVAASPTQSPTPTPSPTTAMVAPTPSRRVLLPRSSSSTSSSSSSSSSSPPSSSTASPPSLSPSASPSPSPSSSSRSSSFANCPPRELILQCLRRYHDAIERDRATFAAVSERITEDLAPFTVLKLGGFSLGNVAPKLLGMVLSSNTTLRTLDLGFNRITDRGATLLAAALEHNRTLESLYLSGNNIGPIGVAALANALRKNSTLRSLHLSGNNIGEDGARELALGLQANTGLRALYIGTNGIGSNGMRCLADALQVNQDLQELTLGQNRLGSDGLKHLAAAVATGRVRLTTLEIGKNGVEVDGVIALAKALCAAPNRLQNLYIDNNPIGDVGASAFAALLAKNAVLRVLDVSYTQMSLLGLRELSVGLSYNASLLCLLVDGHDWSSTQYMKKTNGLSGMALSAKGANNFAASCILGAIQQNHSSALCKLSGVDLSLVISSLPISEAEKQALMTEMEGRDGAPTAPRRPMDVLARNERVLKALQNHRALAVPQLKRKSSCESTVEEERETAPPQPQRQKTAYHKLTVNTNLPPIAPTSSTGPRSTPTPSRASMGARGPSLVRRPSWPADRGGLALKSPRYESTMEVHVRKVLGEIGKLPFNAEEYAMLQTYYLGGCNSPKTPQPLPQPTPTPTPSPCGSDETHPDGSAASAPTGPSSREPPSSQVHCPACRTSRLARYPKTMVLKSRLEAQPEASAAVFVLLRQLHYLVSVFQHVDHAELRVDELLVAFHGDDRTTA